MLYATDAAACPSACGAGGARGSLAREAQYGARVRGCTRRLQRSGWMRLRGVLLLLAGLLILAASCSDEGNPACTDGPCREKKWTLMLYDAADLNDAYDPMGEFCERVNSGSELNVLILQDTRDDSARIWYVDAGHAAKNVREMGEVNMGRSQTLLDFLEYSKQYYPAKRYIMAFYGHGRGWLGACRDASNGNDYLTMDEMRSALGGTGGVDLVLFTGPCLMAAIESVYELRECTDVYVGSEDLSYYCWWDYPMEDICRTLHENPEIDNYDLAVFIVEAILEDSDRWESYEWGDELTMSAVRTDRIAGPVNTLDSIALDYLNGPERLRTCMDVAGPGMSTFYGQHPDICDLAGGILTAEGADTTRTLLESLRDGIGGAVIAECHGEAWSGAHGLTVYFPFESHSGSSDLYGSETLGLDFTEHTNWDELLNAYPYPGPRTADGSGLPDTHRVGYCPLGRVPPPSRLPQSTRVAPPTRVPPPARAPSGP